jgi:5-methylcytosine-specific restriction endonuclease McrA
LVISIRSAAHAGKVPALRSGDREAQRAYQRRYYAENRDKILAGRRAKREARSPKRPPRERLTTEARRAAARAASKRWRERNWDRYAPRRRKLDRERYAAKRESVLAATRERYASDPAFAERIRGRNNAWYQRNRDQRRDYQRRYRQEHGDELRARARARRRREYAKDPRARLDYYKQWRLRNLERARAYVRVSGNKRRTAAEGKHFTFAEWEELLHYHAGHCAYCGSIDRIEADHRVPLYGGGSNEITNILPACRHCNRRKHRRTEDEFRALLQAERAADLTRAGGTDWGSRRAAAER